MSHLGKQSVTLTKLFNFTTPVLCSVYPMKSFGLHPPGEGFLGVRQAICLS